MTALFFAIDLAGHACAREVTEQRAPSLAVLMVSRPCSFYGNSRATRQAIESLAETGPADRQIHIMVVNHLVLASTTEMCVFTSSLLALTSK